jgi:hypothetical protein
MRTIDYYITRSGKLEQQYVLWMEVTIVSGIYSLSEIRGMGNVGMTESVAIRAAEKRINVKLNESVTRSGTLKTLSLCESRKRDTVQFEAFGVHFKVTPRGYMADATGKFWDAWKADKIAVKASGFSCFKMDDCFKMFFRKEL